MNGELLKEEFVRRLGHVDHVWELRLSLFTEAVKDLADGTHALVHRLRVVASEELFMCIKLFNIMPGCEEKHKILNCAEWSEILQMQREDRMLTAS